MKTLKKLILISVAGTALVSCEMLNTTPHVICAETFYTSEKEMTYGLAGIYGAMNSLAVYGQKYSIYMYGVDDLCFFNRATTNQPTNIFLFDASNTEVYDCWTWLYKGINNANAFMEAIPATGLDKDGSFYAEARFLRAYYHFMLAQAWGDVPLRDKAVTSPELVNKAASSQYDVLNWAVKEMEACLPTLPSKLDNAPSRVVKTTAQGIIARVYLFMAGQSVKRPADVNVKDLYLKSRESAKAVIESNLHKLNPSYEQVFINMIADKYDDTYQESMWEAEFKGDRSSAEAYSNGTIGTMNGLQATNVDNIDKHNANYSYAQYTGSLKLWDLYWTEDRTADENQLPTVTDVRQNWNLPPYNYAGSTTAGIYPDGGTEKPVNSIDKTPYRYGGKSTIEDPLCGAGQRNAAKWRREVIYEGRSSVAKAQFNQINFPILRYSDVLLMFAEADLEYSGAVSQEAYDAVKAVRDRAHVATIAMGNYTADTFRKLVRNERGRELCFEALRRPDLVRWGELQTAMNDYITMANDTRWNTNALTGYAVNWAKNVKPQHVVFPIPAIELGVNSLLKQNELW